MMVPSEKSMETVQSAGQSRPYSFNACAALQYGEGENAAGGVWYIGGAAEGAETRDPGYGYENEYKSSEDPGGRGLCGHPCHFGIGGFRGVFAQKSGDFT